MSKYEALEIRFGRVGRLASVEQVLGWDSATMMPPGGAGDRAEQLAAVRLTRHELLCAPWLEAAFAEAAEEPLDPWQRQNLEEMRRAWCHATAVPARLVEAFSKAGSACEGRWRTARGASDFATLEPLLAEVVALTREVAAAKADALGRSPYDALLDQWEPGCSAAEIDTIFDALAAFLPDFTERVIERQAAADPPLPLEGPFEIEAQRRLGLRLMEALGFDLEGGRLDTSHHPFCGGSPGDVRITSRYTAASFMSGLMGVVHETGHALYEQGLPAAWRFQPVGEARGMAFHESQSLLIEMQACRSRPFVRFVAPLIREAFGRSGPAFEPDNLYRHYTQVRRGLIRVNADEVTYPAHVILRYRLERALIAGELRVAELPEAWRESMRALVGVVPPDDGDGCLQDIHWMDGTFGYFPTYTLGAMTAAQLFDAATRADAELLPAIGRGEFQPLVAWLRAHVHCWGSRFDRHTLLERATGRRLDPSVFIAHLKRRYLS